MSVCNLQRTGQDEQRGRNLSRPLFLIHNWIALRFVSLLCEVQEEKGEEEEKKMEMSIALDHFASCSSSSTKLVCSFSYSSFSKRNGPNRLGVGKSSSILSTTASSSAKGAPRVEAFEEGALERPRWTGDDPLSRFVSSLIAVKPLFKVMKIGARQVLIRSVLNSLFPYFWVVRYGSKISGEVLVL